MLAGSTLLLLKLWVAASYAAAPTDLPICDSFTPILQQTIVTRADHYERIIIERYSFSIPDSKQTLPDSCFPHTKAYRNTVQRVIGDADPFSLINRQRDLFLVAFGPASTRIHEAVLSGQIGRIRAINTLEMWLLEQFYSRLSHPLEMREFGAHILYDRSESQGFVYFVWGADSPVVPKTQEVREALHADLRAGLRLVAHLHNHPFALSGIDVAGTLIPSGNDKYGDIACYLNDNAEFGLEKASIINSFQAIEIQSSEFRKLERISSAQPLTPKRPRRKVL